MRNLKKIAVFFVFFICIFFFVLVFTTAQQPQPRRCPLNKDFLSPPSVHFGLIPHPVDLSHIQPGARGLVSLPVSWDWRLNNGVSSAKDQGTCGSCWAFAAVGDLEASILVNSGDLYNFSEENLKECNYWERGCGGGHAFAATNYFTRKGVVSESCDPYNAWNTGFCNTSCVRYKQVTGWRILPNDVASIKNAVYLNGPCYTTIYASFSGFSSYDGSYCLYYDGVQAPSHAVLIVGWDDNMEHAGGSGAWICKNSWGASWGDNGFFYIAYDSARIGEGSCYYKSYKQYDYLEMMGTLYHFDEAGWYDSWGFGSPNSTAWGLVKFTSSKDDCVRIVDFWAVDDNMSYEIYIYDDFDGQDLSNLLHSQSGTCLEAGYYSVELDAPVWVENGGDFIVAIKFTCTNYYYPVPCDGFAPIESGKCYLSQTGSSSSWIEMGDGYDRDISIRARMKNHQHVFAGHDFNGDGVSDIAVWRPSDGKWYIKNNGIYHWGTDGDIPVPGDYNGDGVSDIAVWRPSDGKWYIKNEGVYQWGAGGDIPVPGDYDGNGTSDIAVWRPSTGYWYISTTGNFLWGQSGDIPIPGDYNGDGASDIAVWRPSDGKWYIKDNAVYKWGALGDYPVPSYYDSDNIIDIAVWRPSDGKWYIRNLGIYSWGTLNDIPVPGDYSGNGTSDIAVWRKLTGKWYLKNIAVYQWGTPADIPLVR